MSKLLTKKDIFISQDKIIHILQSKKEYAETLDVKDLLARLESSNMETLNEKVRRLESEHQQKLQEMIELNNKTHDAVLHYVEKFKNEYFLQLNSIAQKVATLLLSSDNSIEILLHRLQDVFDTHTININTALARNLKIELSAKDYDRITLWFETRENIENIKWILEFIRVNTNLETGIAIINDDYLNITVSVEQVVKHLANMLTSEFNSVIAELNNSVPDLSINPIATA